MAILAYLHTTQAWGITSIASTLLREPPPKSIEKRVRKLFVRIRGQGSIPETMINLSQVVRVEFERKNARSAEVTLWYSDGETEKWTGELGGRILEILEQHATLFVP